MVALLDCGYHTLRRLVGCFWGLVGVVRGKRKLLRSGYLKGKPLGFRVALGAVDVPKSIQFPTHPYLSPTSFKHPPPPLDGFLNKRR